jgi:hypothetical protein
MLAPARFSTMPRFYFHLFDDLDCFDEEGQELPSPETALETARANVLDIACAEVGEGRLDLSHRIEVANEFGQSISVPRFRDVIEVAG